MAVVVQVVNHKRVVVFGIRPPPIDELAAPVARKSTRANLVIEDGAMLKHAPISHREGMLRLMDDAIAFWCQRANGKFRASISPYSLNVHATVAAFRMWALATLDVAMLLPAAVAHVSVVFLAPVVFLAQAVGKHRLLAALNRAMWRPIRKALGNVRFGCARVTAILAREFVVRQDDCRLPASFADDSNRLVMAFLVRHVSPLPDYILFFTGRRFAATNPHYYSHTFCVGCRDHLPISEFVWEPDNVPLNKVAGEPGKDLRR